MVLVPPDSIEWLRAGLPKEVRVFLFAARAVYTNVWFWVLVGGILGLERLRPANPTQRTFSWGMLQDVVWFNMDLVFQAVAIPVVAGATQLVYIRATGNYQIPFLDEWPAAGRIIVALVLFDFLMWFSHWVRHKVRAFWYFHAIHHSQRELNLFTEMRVHVAEHVISNVLLFVPLLALNLNAYTIVGVGAVRLWYDRLVHANLRSNFGPLKHVLVSPQYHRIHHSIEARHQDKNLGAILTIWDRLFGTLYPHYDEYPATGVQEIVFEPARSFAPLALLRDYVRLFLFPFGALRRGELRSRVEGSAPSGEG